MLCTVRQYFRGVLKMKSKCSESETSVFPASDLMVRPLIPLDTATIQQLLMLCKNNDDFFTAYRDVASVSSSCSGY